MGGPKGHQRGRKTHRADVKLNRGPHEEPKQKTETPDSEKKPSQRQEQAHDEHPTRMTARGHRAGPDKKLR